MNEDEVRKIILEILRELLTGAMTPVRVMDNTGTWFEEIQYVDDIFREHVFHELDVIEEKKHR